MASGRTHDAASRACAFIGAGLSLGLAHTAADFLGIPADASFNIAAATGAFVGGMAGLILSPDLDLVNRNNGGCMALNFWRAIALHRYWRVYGLLPHHSPLSHWPVLGTLGRLAYCAPFWLVPGWALAPYSDAQLIFLATAVLNLAVADCLHWVLDGAPYGTGNRYLLRWR